MKRILLIPIETEGVVDVRTLDYLILDDIKYLEQIQSNLIANGKDLNKYKYCQFEGKAKIPFFIKIKNKLGNGLQEFEVEKLTFNEIDGEDYKKELIEERHVLPLQKKINSIMIEANNLIILEKLGEEISEEKFLDLGIEKEKLEKEIEVFDYKSCLNEIV